MSDRFSQLPGPSKAPPTAWSDDESKYQAAEEVGGEDAGAGVTRRRDKDYELMWHAIRSNHDEEERTREKRIRNLLAEVEEDDEEEGRR